jgi:hypothetical protein
MNGMARSREISFAGASRQVDVVGHDGELVEEKFLLHAIGREGVNQKSGSHSAAEDRKALEGDGGDEEDAVGFHCVMFAGMCERCL